MAEKTVACTCPDDERLAARGHLFNCPELTVPLVRWPATVEVYGCLRCQLIHRTCSDLNWCHRGVTLRPQEGVHYVIKNYKMSD